MCRVSQVCVVVLALALAVAASWPGQASASAQGETWVSIGPEGGPIYAIAVDPQTPATLYAGTYGGGVFKSANGGGNWTALNTGLTNMVVHAIALDPQSPGTLYAGTEGGVSKLVQVHHSAYLPIVRRAFSAPAP